MSEIEHKQWKAPFSEGQPVIFDLRWGRGGISYRGEISGDFEVAPKTDEELPALEISVCSLKSESFYRVADAPLAADSRLQPSWL